MTRWISILLLLGALAGIASPQFPKPVAGASGASGGGGGGGATSADQLTTLQVVYVSANVLAIGGTCSSSHPCNVLVGSSVCQILTGYTATISSGNPSAYIGVDSSCVVNVWYTSASGVACSGGSTCTPLTGSFPAGVFPVWTWTAVAVAGQWDALGGTDLRSVYKVDKRIDVLGAGVVTTRGATVDSFTLIPVDDPSIFYLHSDFCTDTGATRGGQVPWVFFGVMANVDQNSAPAALVKQHPCILQVASTTTPGSGGQVLFNATNTGAIYRLDANMPFTSYTSRWIFLADEGANAGTSPFAISTDNVSGFVGFIMGTQGGSNMPLDVGDPSIGVSYSSVAPAGTPCASTGGSAAYNTAHLMYAASNGGTAFCLDSGVAAQANVWYNITISGTPSSGATFCINGASCQTIPAANLPANGLTPRVGFVTNTGAVKNIWLNYFSFLGFGLTR